LSDIRFGVECGLIKDISRELLNELMICTQPGFLQMVTNKALKPSERDEKRATILRNKICKSSKEDE
jgi:protein arginine kinase